MKQGRLTLMLVLLLFANIAKADTPLSYVIYGPGGHAQTIFSQSLETQLGMVAKTDANAPQLIIALGVAALRKACGVGVPVLATQVSKQQIQVARSQGCRSAAIHSHADPAVQFSLQRMLLPGAKRVGVLLSDETRNLLPLLKRYAESTQVTLLVEDVGDSESLPSALAALLVRVDVIIALPDKNIFNAENARLLLMAGYRQGKPIIGPDDHWVRAGSLAAAYVPSENLVATFLSVMTRFKRTGKLGGDRFPSVDFAFNEGVAEAFSIKIPEAESLRELGVGR